MFDALFVRTHALVYVCVDERWVTLLSFCMHRTTPETPLITDGMEVYYEALGACLSDTAPVVGGWSKCSNGNFVDRRGDGLQVKSGWKKVGRLKDTCDRERDEIT